MSKPIWDTFFGGLIPLALLVRYQCRGQNILFSSFSATIEYFIFPHVLTYLSVLSMTPLFIKKKSRGIFPQCPSPRACH